MRKLTVYVVLALSPVCVPALADDDAVIKKAVSECVASVRSRDAYNQRFDAFYNTATHLVENNVIYAQDRGLLFLFNKCMAEHGLPLK